MGRQFPPPLGDPPRARPRVSTADILEVRRATGWTAQFCASAPGHAWRERCTTAMAVAIANLRSRWQSRLQMRHDRKAEAVAVCSRNGKLKLKFDFWVPSNAFPS